MFRRILKRLGEWSVGGSMLLFTIMHLASICVIAQEEGFVGLVLSAPCFFLAQLYVGLFIAHGWGNVYLMTFLFSVVLFVIGAALESASEDKTTQNAA